MSAVIYHTMSKIRYELIIDTAATVLQKYRQKQRVSRQKRAKTNDIYEIRRVFDAFCGNTQRNALFPVIIPVSFGEIAEIAGNVRKQLAYIYIKQGGGTKKYEFKSYLAEMWDECMSDTDAHLVVAQKPKKAEKK